MSIKFDNWKYRRTAHKNATCSRMKIVNKTVTFFMTNLKKIYTCFDSVIKQHSVASTIFTKEFRHRGRGFK